MNAASCRRANLAWAKASEAQAIAEEASAVALVAAAEAQHVEGRDALAGQYLRLAEHSRMRAAIYSEAADQFRRLAG